MNNYHTIINPNTNRRVNITSKLGRQILNKYINQLGGNNDDKKDILDNAKVYAPDKYFEGLNADETKKRLKQKTSLNLQI